MPGGYFVGSSYTLGRTPRGIRKVWIGRSGALWQTTDGLYGRLFLGYGASPSSRARTTAWVRSETPSLAIMCRTCTLAVALLIERLLVISSFVLPRSRRPNTSTSRGVKFSRRGGAALAPLSAAQGGAEAWGPSLANPMCKFSR